MTKGPVRLLLDEGFPHAPSGLSIETLDRTVEYSHFSDVAPDFANVRTPDWLVYLLARDLGFKALVTSDHSQLEQDEELIALSLSKINLITWKGRQEDPVVMWGQLLAYMPQVLPHLGRPQLVIRLPNPHLQPRDHVLKVTDLIGARQVRDRLSFSERRNASLKVMRKELKKRGRNDLEAYLSAGRPATGKARPRGDLPR